MRSKSLADQFTESRLNYAMYALILIVAFFIVYFVVARYTIVKAATTNKLTAELLTNEVQEFTDGTHPVISVKTDARLASVIHINIESDAQMLSFTSGEYMTSYTRLIVLPTEMQGKDIRMSIIAEDRTGNTMKETINFRTKAKEEVKFSIR